MDFQLSDEQGLLRDTTRDLLSRTYDPESRNKIIGSDLGWSREVWNQLADTGILGLGFEPEESGQIEIMVVLTEVGRRLAPEPVLHAALGPGALIAELGSDEQKQLLDEVAGGQRLLAFAHLEPGQRNPSAEVTTKAAQQGDSWTLSGRKNPVLAGDCADTLVVSAALPSGGTGLFVVDAASVTRHPYKTFDGQRAADMYVSLELARSMTLYAGMSIADGNLDPVIASRAKLQIGRSGRHIAQESVQMHGGIGVTAEYPVSHYAARLTAIENTLGTSGEHLHNLIDHLGDYELVRL
jgi:alkylation response protein AidB-like acyl-CoA dehydrogenase